MRCKKDFTVDEGWDCPFCGCENIDIDYTQRMAISILEEAISRIKGNEYNNVWQGARGINCDAIDLAIETVKKV